MRARWGIVGCALWLCTAVAGLAAGPKDTGSRAEFIGFVGKHEEYGLIYVTPFRPAVEPAMMYLVPLQGDGATAVQWPVALHASVLDEQPSPKRFHEYYLFRLAKIQRQQLGDNFAEPAARVTPMPLRVAAPAPAPLVQKPKAAAEPDPAGAAVPAPAAPPPPQWSAADRAVFQVGTDQYLSLRVEVRETLNGARPVENRRGYTCSEWIGETMLLHCESCALHEMDSGLGKRAVALCRKGEGRLTRNVSGGGSKIWPRGIKCDCDAPAYDWAPELTWNNTTRLGVATLATPMDADPAIFRAGGDTWGPPQIAVVDNVPEGVSAYRNHAGDVIVVGSAVRKGPDQTVHFPLIGTIAEPPVVVPPAPIATPEPVTSTPPPVPDMPVTLPVTTPVTPPAEPAHAHE